MAEAAVNNQVEMIFTRIALALESLVTAQRLPKPVPTIFNGSSDAHGAELFFTQFESYATSLYGIETAVHLQILPNFLDGEPKEIALAYGPSAEYVTVKQRIISEQSRRFSLESNPLTEFFAMKRRPGESLVVLSIRLETALNRIQHLNPDGRKSILHSKLLSLMHPEVVKRIDIQFCNTANVALDDIVNLGSQLENIFKYDVPPPPLQFPALSQNIINPVASVHSPKKHSKPCVPTNKPMHMSPVTVQSDVPCASSVTQTRSSNVHSISQPSSFYYAKFKCHRCHKFGHIRKFCTVPKPSKAKLFSGKSKRHLHTNVKPQLDEISCNSVMSSVPSNFYSIAPSTSCEIDRNVSPNSNCIVDQPILPCPLLTADDSYENLFPELENNDFVENLKEISETCSNASTTTVEASKQYAKLNCMPAKYCPSVSPTPCLYNNNPMMSKHLSSIGTIFPVVK